MDRAQVFDTVREKAVELLKLDAADVQDDRSFVADLKVDSLSLVEYTMDLEDVFGVELAEEELADLPTIGALVDLVHTKVLAK